jgi:hypothetical protein
MSLQVFSSMSKTASTKVEALSESISEAAFGSEIQALMIVVSEGGGGVLTSRFDRWLHQRRQVGREGRRKDVLE